MEPVAPTRAPRTSQVGTTERVGAPPRLSLGSDALRVTSGPRRVLPANSLGTTYTKHAAQAGGLTHAEAFKLMHEMGVKVVRLGAYWDAIQAKGPDGYDFEEIDEQLALARQYGMKVVLSVGIKSPGWPEAYIPDWAKPKQLIPDKPATLRGKVDAWLGANWNFYRKVRGENAPPTNLAQDPDLRRHALAYAGKLVAHVAANEHIVAFQVENEPGMPFGPRHDYVGWDFVQEEARAIRAADPFGRPLAMNSSIPPRDQEKKMISSGLFSLVGFDIYPKPAGNFLGKDRPGSIGVDMRMNRAPRAAKAFAEKHGLETYVAEMQAEPWTVVGWNPGKTMTNFHAQRRNGFDMIMPWNIGYVFKELKNGNRSEFDAWKQIGRELEAGTPPPPPPGLLDKARSVWRHLGELWTGVDSGKL
ncbi:MAG: beta-galactosidase [Candidatus Sericytochromatia bacterium]|nr:beta-galactosidase [Candidatus Tanganyikabacteria bacterium]